MMTSKKFCSTCRKQRSLKLFCKNRGTKDGYNTWCNKCRSRYRKTRGKEKIQSRQIWLLRYLKAHPCVDCGERDLIVLEFDHVRGKKMYKVSELARGEYSLKKLQEEVSKCEVRCANCHRRKTAIQLGWYSGIDLTQI